MKLAPAPQRVVGSDGKPLLGRFSGAAESFDWHLLAGEHARSSLWRRFHHKKWHYVSLVSEQVMAAVAIVDLGWTSTCFAYAFDRNDSDMMANFSQDGLPGRLSVGVGEHAGAASWFRTRSTQISIEPLEGERYRWLCVARTWRSTPNSARLSHRCCWPPVRCRAGRCTAPRSRPACR